MADPPSITLPWGATLTLLSPTPKRLTALWAGWEKFLRAARNGERSPQTYQERARSAKAAVDLEALAAEPSKKDDTAPNGSSIAFLFEYSTFRALFAGDAFSTVLYPALARVARSRREPVLELDLFKIPHHGSQANVLLPLFDVVRAKHYLVSTNGAHFEHPDDQAIARVITHGGPGHTLWFNYANDRTLRWNDPQAQSRYGYRTEYPQTASGGNVLSF